MLLETIFDDLYDLNRTMNRMFVTYPARRPRANKWPNANVYENHDDYVIVAKVPGVEKSDIAITVKDNSLKISGERKKENLENATNYFDERFSGKFERSFLLNEKIDAEKIDAELNNGLLMIKLPKSPEAKAKNITIK
jgi:HSP20 family protein